MPYTWTFTSNATMTIDQWNSFYYGNQPMAQVFTFPTLDLWSNLRERDRFHLARARPTLAPLLSTPTIPVPLRLTLIPSHRRSGWGSRWERSPLNKRAVARR